MSSLATCWILASPFLAQNFKVNPDLASGRNVSRFQITPDGTAIYVADQDSDNVFELYGVPTDGSQVARS